MRALYGFVAGFFVSGLVVGCGSTVSGGGGETGATAEGPLTWTSYCEARSSACGITLDVCAAQEACARGLIRDDVEDDLFACLASTCDENVCWDVIRASWAPTAGGEQFHDAWQGYINACPSGNDDVEFAAWVVADDRIGDFTACAEAQGCDAAAGCFSQVHAAHVDVCNGWF